jgi:hypothetical protein
MIEETDLATEMITETETTETEIEMITEEVMITEIEDTETGMIGVIESEIEIEIMTDMNPRGGTENFSHLHTHNSHCTLRWKLFIVCSL